jgi:hypothetical protein
MTPPPNGASHASRDPARIVVVVPRKEIQLHDYLRRSLGALKNVEVVLDRRAVTIAHAEERRRQPSTSSESRILMCSLVRCPPAEAVESQSRPGRAEADRARFLGWPALRLENL